MEKKEEGDKQRMKSCLSTCIYCILLFTWEASNDGVKVSMIMRYLWDTYSICHEVYEFMS